MKCPLHRDMTDEPHECRLDCAWLMDNACMVDSDAGFQYTCAIAVIAEEIGSENLYCASNHMRPKEVGE